MNKFESLVKGSFAVTIGTFIGGVISYIFSIFIGRMLGPQQFGDFGAINSLLLLFTSGGSAVLTVTMHYTGKLYFVGNYSGLKKLDRYFTRFLIFLALAIIIIVALAAPLIANWFHINNTWALIIALFSILFSLPLVVKRGILQGTQTFWQFSATNITEMLVKLLAALLFVKLGFGLTGAVIALVVCELATYFLGVYYVKNLIEKKDETHSNKFILKRSEVLSYAWPTLLSTVALLLLINMDVILVKRFFDPVQAGQYIAVSTIAKIIFYITGPISSVMFPLITEHQTKGEKHYHTLLLSLILTAICSVLILGVYMLFSTRIVTALYGVKYQALGYLLPSSAWLVVFVALVNLMTNYFMSIKKFSFLICYAIAFIALIIVVLGHGVGTLANLIYTLRLIVAGLFGLMIVYYLFIKRVQLMAFFKPAK